MCPGLWGPQRMTGTQLSHSVRPWQILSTIGVWEVPWGKRGEGGSFLPPPSPAHLANQLHLSPLCRLSFHIMLPFEKPKRDDLQTSRAWCLWQSVPRSGLSILVGVTLGSLLLPQWLSKSHRILCQMRVQEAVLRTREGSWPWRSLQRD